MIDPQIAGLTAEEGLGDGEQQSRAVARLGVGGGGAPMRDTAERPDGGLHDVAGGGALDIRDEADAAGVPFRVVLPDHVLAPKEKTPARGVWAQAA